MAKAPPSAKRDRIKAFTPALVDYTNDVVYGDEGDDWLYGMVGDDVMFGGLGQDDLIGGSSDLFTLDVYNVSTNERPDGSDLIFGGAGTHVSRNDTGTLAGVPSNQVHARDADTILNDNGDIFRLVGVSHSDSGGWEQVRGPKRRFALDDLTKERYDGRCAQNR